MTANTTPCGWWAFAPGGFHTETYCALAHGHDGDHQDQRGDVVRMPCDAERIGPMCARYDEDDSGTLCAQEPEHAGPCRNRAGYVFDAEDAGEDHAPAPDRAVIDALARELTAIMANPGHPAHASIRLRQCDRLFGAIDRHMREGGALPFGWQIDPDASVPVREYTTAAYDILSEELRTRGDVTTARRALASAARWWDALVATMREGGPLPEPWERDA